MKIYIHIIPNTENITSILWSSPPPASSTSTHTSLHNYPQPATSHTVPYINIQNPTHTHVQSHPTRRQTTLGTQSLTPAQKPTAPTVPATFTGDTIAIPIPVKWISTTQCNLCNP